MPIIETDGLTKRYKDVLAVDRVSLSVEEGQVFGFLGPNGSGKTTTIGMLVGIITPTAGSFRLFGASSRGDLLAVRSRVGATLETPNFYPYLSGRDNMRIAARVKGVGKRRIEECLDLVGLSDRGKHKFKTYSLGMKQRLALAATMLNDPELIVLDEPANGLDPQGMREVREIIRILAQRGKTIFLSSHLLWEVERTCTHVAIVRKGQIIRSGSVEDVVRNADGHPGQSQSAALVRAEDEGTLRQALEAYPDAVSVQAAEDGAGLVVGLGSGDLSQLNRYLAERDIFLSHLALQRQTLEDAFIHLTDGDDAPMAEIAS